MWVGQSLELTKSFIQCSILLAWYIYAAFSDRNYILPKKTVFEQLLYICIFQENFSEKIFKRSILVRNFTAPSLKIL